MLDEQRPIERWPAGHRAAIVLSFDVDSTYGVINAHGADAWQWRSQAMYDLEVGVWRLLGILADFDIAATFCWVGAAAEDRPDAVRAAVDAGHEIATHGWDHRYYTSMTDDEQRDDIERTRDMLEQISGVRPTGHKTPGWRFNEETANILNDLGFSWQMDYAAADLPFYTAPAALEASRPLLQLPPSPIWDDYAYFVENMLSPSQVFEMWQAELNVIRAEGKLICATFHPFVSGRPGPSQALTMFLDYVVSLGDVWIARADQVTDWWQERFPPL